MNISSGYLKKMGYLVFVITIFTFCGCGVGSTVEGNNDTAGNDIIIDDIKTQTDSSVMDVQRDSEMKDIVNDVNDVEISDTTDDVAGDRCIPNCTKKECGDDGCGGSCGSCGDNAVCNGNKCECISGFGNCNGKWDDGCEANFSTDPHHCSDCATDCGDNSICNNKTCACQSGYFNCDGIWINGCEVDLNDPATCGKSCDNKINCGQNSVCNNGVCGCQTGYANCDGLLSNGCEVDLNSINSCGTSCSDKVICSKNNGSNPVCDSGVCKLTCNSGYEDCNAKAGSSDGCEVNLNSINSCGTNCSNIVKCSYANGSNPVCDNGLCLLSCNSGYADCNYEYGKSDGCEVRLNSSATCGTNCWDIVNCGGYSVCKNGVCECQVGYANCDGDWNNGCEINMTNDENNCGGCNIACGIGEKCINSKCGKGYRRQISINNASSTDLANYQVSFTINTSELISAGKMRSDCGDIRLYDTDGTTELSYWVEDGCNSTSTKVWVKVPDIAANSTKIIYLQYGELDLTSKSNGDDVFLFFDDFPGSTLDTSKWTYIVNPSYISVSSSIVTLNQKDEWSKTSIKRDITPPVIVEAKALFYYSSGQPRFRFLSPNHPYADIGIFDNYRIFWDSFTNIYLSGNIWYKLKSIIRSSKVDWNIIGIYSNSYIPTATPSNFFFSSSYWSSGDGYIQLDWVFVRQYISPEPTVTVGQEE